jgi:hypothetical protein
MGLLEKLQKEFSDHEINLEHKVEGHWEVTIDGKKLRLQFRDWSELFEKLYNLDIREELFEQVSFEIKKELKKQNQ